MITFDRFWCFMRYLGQYWKLASSSKPTHHNKLSFSWSVTHCECCQIWLVITFEDDLPWKGVVILRVLTVFWVQNIHLNDCNDKRSEGEGAEVVDDGDAKELAQHATRYFRLQKISDIHQLKSNFENAEQWGSLSNKKRFKIWSRFS